MIKPPDISIIPLMESIKNQELSYNNFCKALNIPKKSTDSIPSQIKSLGVYCKIEINTERYPKTYKIIEIGVNLKEEYNKMINYIELSIHTYLQVATFHLVYYILFGTIFNPRAPTSCDSLKRPRNPNFFVIFIS